MRSFVGPALILLVVAGLAQTGASGHRYLGASEGDADSTLHIAPDGTVFVHVQNHLFRVAANGSDIRTIGPSLDALQSVLVVDGSGILSFPYLAQDTGGLIVANTTTPPGTLSVFLCQSFDGGETWLGCNGSGIGLVQVDARSRLASGVAPAPEKVVVATSVARTGGALLDLTPDVLFARIAPPLAVIPPAGAGFQIGQILAGGGEIAVPARDLGTSTASVHHFVGAPVTVPYVPVGIPTGRMSAVMPNETCETRPCPPPCNPECLTWLPLRVEESLLALVPRVGEPVPVPTGAATDVSHAWAFARAGGEVGVAYVATKADGSRSVVVSVASGFPGSPAWRTQEVASCAWCTGVTAGFDRWGGVHVAWDVASAGTSRQVYYAHLPP